MRIGQVSWIRITAGVEGVCRLRHPFNENQFRATGCMPKQTDGLPPIPNDSSGSRHDRCRCHAKSGSTLRPMGPNPVYFDYHTTLISHRSCLKPVDTFRGVHLDFLHPHERVAEVRDGRATPGAGFPAGVKIVGHVQVRPQRSLRVVPDAEVKGLGADRLRPLADLVGVEREVGAEFWGLGPLPADLDEVDFRMASPPIARVAGGV